MQGRCREYISGVFSNNCVTFDFLAVRISHSVYKEDALKQTVHDYSGDFYAA